MTAARARLRAVWEWFRDPGHRRGLQVGLVLLGLEALRNVVIDHHNRLEELERTIASGTVPLDDVVTLEDLNRAKGELRAELAAGGRADPPPPPA